VFPDEDLLRAMLECEAALARAEAEAGLVPEDAARAIAEVCGSARIGPLDSLAAGNPVVPLVRELGALLPEHARPWLHHGATSQDILDTALMLYVQRSLPDVQEALDACAGLVREHRHTLMPARTLGQQAGPTTFGLKAAGWLTGLAEASDRVPTTLPVQLGGATGTLAALGDVGVVEGFARRLGLAVPTMPWHTNRQPVLSLASALAGLVVACGKVALDVTLLAQTEVGEVSEGAGGGSSALPHKQNPVRSVLVIAAARRVPGLLSTLYAAGLHEHERATGSWHAEWEPLLELARLTRSAVDLTAGLLTGLRVHPDRMRANLDLTGGLVMSESVAARLAPSLGRTAAHDLVARLGRAALETGTPLREQLLAEGLLTEDEIAAALDPANWLGATDVLIDRALAAYERSRG
jgi:3-carboxy-cis,cis-muconate cycloisomerase